MSAFATLDALRESLVTGRAPVDPAYAEKQIHALPEAPVVDRGQFIRGRCRGQTVLDVGASGPLHAAIVNASAKCYGLDKHGADGVEAVDLDDVTATFPVYPDVTLVVCGEVLEHLANPGWFLRRLKAGYRCPLLVTVPNAFNAINQRAIRQGHENVNREHVAWHSPRTIRTLLERYGYQIAEFAWYKGQPGTAEGLIVVTE